MNPYLFGDGYRPEGRPTGGGRNAPGDAFLFFVQCAPFFKGGDGRAVMAKRTGINVTGSEPRAARSLTAAYVPFQLTDIRPT
jgi:hypothetical protein